MRYLFGQDISYTFVAKDADGNTVAPSADAPDIYVFFQSKPDITTAQAGTGAVAHITSWADAAGSVGKTFTIPAIDNPYPNSFIAEYPYYVAINFTLKAGEQTQTVIHEICISRVHGQESKPEVTVALIKEFFPAISAYLTDDQISDSMDLALDHVIADLRAKGFEWADLRNVYLYKLPLAWKTIYLAVLPQKGDEKRRIEEAAKAEYAATLGQVSVPVDVDNQGQNTATAQVISYGILVR